MRSPSPSPDHDTCYNQLGQRIGRKGRNTRDRIIAAVERLLADSSAPQITLVGVAREASLAMPSLYSYFRDLSELIGAVLEPVMDATEEAYVRRLRTYWLDGELGEKCRDFVTSYYHFWRRHGRILQLRNSMSDSGDKRMRRFRQTNSTPLLQLFLHQMDYDDPGRFTLQNITAGVLTTGLERLITVMTDPDFPELCNPSGPGLAGAELELQTELMLESQAWLLEVAIRAGRLHFPRALNGAKGNER